MTCCQNKIIIWLVVQVPHPSRRVFFLEQTSKSWSRDAHWPKLTYVHGQQKTSFWTAGWERWLLYLLRWQISLILSTISFISSSEMFQNLLRVGLLRFCLSYSHGSLPQRRHYGNVFLGKRRVGNQGHDIFLMSKLLQKLVRSCFPNHSCQLWYFGYFLQQIFFAIVEFSDREFWKVGRIIIHLIIIIVCWVSVGVEVAALLLVF